MQGTMAKKQFAKFFFPAFFIHILGWTIARALSPLGYFLNNNMISTQGNLLLNPVGAWFFITSTIQFAIMVIFYIRFLYRRFVATSKVLAQVFQIFGIIGAFSFIFVPIFYEGIGFTGDIIHGIAAYLTFIGLGLAALLSLIIMFSNILKKHFWPQSMQFLGLFCLLLQMLLVLPFTLVGSVMQWIGFLTIDIWILGMFIISPENPEEG
jgi:hypothetical protein